MRTPRATSFHAVVLVTTLVGCGDPVASGDPDATDATDPTLDVGSDFGQFIRGSTTRGRAPSGHLFAAGGVVGLGDGGFGGPEALDVWRDGAYAEVYGPSIRGLAFGADRVLVDWDSGNFTWSSSVRRVTPTGDVLPYPAWSEDTPFDLVWTTPTWRHVNISDLVTTIDGEHDVLVALTTDGGFPDEFPGLDGATDLAPSAVVRISGATGAIEQVVALGEARGAIVGNNAGAGSLLATPDGGFVVVTPGVAGDPIVPGGQTLPRAFPILVRAFDRAGALRWWRGFGPGGALDGALSLSADEVMVLPFGLGPASRVNFGDGMITAPATGFTRGAVGIDLRDGHLRWRRRGAVTTNSATIGVAAARDDGLTAWIETITQATDFGGVVGTLGGEHPGATLVVGLLDACGVMVAAKTFNECDCTYDDPAGAIAAREAVWTPEGDLVLLATVNGYYRFGGGEPGAPASLVAGDLGHASITESWGMWLTLRGPERQAGHGCAAPPPPDPTLRVVIVGQGAVSVETNRGSASVGTCSEGSCDFEAPLFEQLRVTAAPADGYRFTGFTGACDGIGTCAPWLDEDLTLTATFVPSALGELVDLSDTHFAPAQLATTADGAVLVGIAEGEASYQGQPLHTGEGTAVVALGLDRTLAPRWSLDLGAHAALGGPHPIALSSVDGGVVLGLSDGSAITTVAWIDPSGALTARVATGSQATNGRLVADAVGNAYISRRVNGWELAGLTPSGATFTLPIGGGDDAVQALAPLPGGAAAVVIVGRAPLQLAGQTFTGGVLVFVDPSGAVGATAVPAGAPADGLVAGVDGLWLVGQGIALPIGADGAPRGPEVSLALTGIVHPVDGGFLIAATTADASTLAGLPVERYGMSDLAIFSLDADGHATAGETFGGPNNDYWLATSAANGVFAAILQTPGGGTVGGRPVGELTLLVR